MGKFRCANSGCFHYVMLPYNPAIYYNHTELCNTCKIASLTDTITWISPIHGYTYTIQGVDAYGVQECHDCFNGASYVIHVQALSSHVRGACHLHVKEYGGVAPLVRPSRANEYCPPCIICGSDIPLHAWNWMFILPNADKMHDHVCANCKAFADETE